MEAVAGKRRPRVSQACERCHRMHVSCSIQRPCLRCTRRGRVCQDRNPVDSSSPLHHHSQNNGLDSPTSTAGSSPLSSSSSSSVSVSSVPYWIEFDEDDDRTSLFRPTFPERLLQVKTTGLALTPSFAATTAAADTATTDSRRIRQGSLSSACTDAFQSEQKWNRYPAAGEGDVIDLYLNLSPSAETSATTTSGYSGSSSPPWSAIADGVDGFDRSAVTPSPLTPPLMMNHHEQSPRLSRQDALIHSFRFMLKEKATVIGAGEAMG